jgi:hypothetical protein
MRPARDNRKSDRALPHVAPDGPLDPAPAPRPGPAATVEVGLTAAILSVAANEPVVLVVGETEDGRPSEGLPSGPFTPLEHRTLEIGLRSWVRRQTGLELGYVEQLYTFGDRGRHATYGDTGTHVVSIGYLALTTSTAGDGRAATWRSWYHYFPWEDRRRDRARTARLLPEVILPRLAAWVATPPPPDTPERPVGREERVRMCFATEGGKWDEEKVLERYELLYEAGIVEEARRDGRPLADPALPSLGPAMRLDHRRILATAIGRIRGKIKYRPVIFELLPDEFTLFELQRTVEAILGPHLHKQNFRRLVESGGLVEPTDEVRTGTGGRPARLYRFRREVLLERPAPGVRINPGR